MPSATLHLYRRLVRQALRDPATYINVVLSLFFLAVYTGAFGGPPQIEALIGGSFLTFILPLSILNAAIAGSAAGQVLVADLESGYLRRLLSLPVARVALVLAPMLLSATLVLVQAGLVLGVGLLVGAGMEAGALGALPILALALLWGLAFGGYSVATGLLAGNAAGAQTAVFVFFPLIFLAPTFLPRDQLQGWLEVVSAVNPTTYVLEAMRAVLLDGWDAGALAAGFGVVGVLCALSVLWATRVAGRVTARA